MTDVSCRALSLFQPAEDAGWADLSLVYAGSPTPTATLRDPRARLPWNEFAVLCDRLADQLGDDRRLRELGALAVESATLRPLTVIAGAVADPRHLYRVSLDWFGPSLFRNVAMTLEDHNERQLTVALHVPEPFRPSQSWLTMAQGLITALPRLLGCRDALVEAQITVRTGVFLIEILDRRTVVARGRRILMALRTGSALLAQLRDQQTELLAVHAGLRASQDELRHMLDAMPNAVCLHRGGTIQFANLRFARAMGMDRADLSGRDADEVAATARAGGHPAMPEIARREGLLFAGQPATMSVYDVGARAGGDAEDRDAEGWCDVAGADSRRREGVTTDLDAALDGDSGVRPRMRVLIIDDEPVLALALADLRDRHHATAVPSGRAALELLSAGERYDVILCSAALPKMTAMELYEAVAAIDQEQRRSFIFITPGARPDRIQRFLREAGAPSLEKPIDPLELNALIEDVTVARGRHPSRRP